MILIDRKLFLGLIHSRNLKLPCLVVWSINYDSVSVCVPRERRPKSVEIKITQLFCLYSYRKVEKVCIKPDSSSQTNTILQVYPTSISSSCVEYNLEMFQ